MAQSTYIKRGDADVQVYKSQTFNIDNGAGTTIDEVFVIPQGITIEWARMVYQEATDTTGVATANCKIGTAVTGAQIVAATACEVSKAVGGYTAMTLVLSKVAANTTIFIRHTGIAATEGGQYNVLIGYRVNP